MPSLYSTRSFEIVPLMSRKLLLLVTFYALLNAGCDRPYHGDLSTAGRIRGTQLIMSEYADAVGSLAYDCGLDMLELTNITDALVANPDWQGWKGPYVPYIRGDLWESPMQFKIAGKNFQIISAGPDQKFGNSDDIIFQRSTNLLLQTNSN